ncbi:MAG: DUF2577 domain-containing protein [Oscillospiraceae bacterium]|jgi:hypothetical protein|nr:DUF2577 domain-containing protein [Oscillospiraceae bacterium]
MSSLHTLIQTVVANYIKNADLTDIAIGTVETEPPELSVKIMGSELPPIKKQALLLTQSVVEQRIVIAKHTHEVEPHKHTDSVGGNTTEESETNLDELVTAVGYVNGAAQPVVSGDAFTVWTNTALKSGDKVLMISVMGGQRYIILSRVFDSYTES